MFEVEWIYDSADEIEIKLFEADEIRNWSGEKELSQILVQVGVGSCAFKTNNVLKDVEWMKNYRFY